MASGVTQFDGRTGQPIDIQNWNARRAYQRIAANNPFDRGKLQSILLPGVAAVHRAQERKLFASEGSSGGDRWRELTPRYAREKRLAGFGNRKILTRTGALRDAMSKKSDPNNIARLVSAGTRILMEFGARSKVGYKHTFEGIVRSGGEAVKRSVIQKTPAQQQEMVAVADTYFRERVTNIVLEGFGLRPRPISDKVRAALGGGE